MAERPQPGFQRRVGTATNYTARKVTRSSPRSTVHPRDPASHALPTSTHSLGRLARRGTRATGTPSPERMHRNPLQLQPTATATAVAVAASALSLSLSLSLASLSHNRRVLTRWLHRSLASLSRASRAPLLHRLSTETLYLDVHATRFSLYGVFALTNAGSRAPIAMLHPREPILCSLSLSSRGSRAIHPEDIGNAIRLALPRLLFPRGRKGKVASREAFRARNASGASIRAGWRPATRLIRLSAG